MKLAYFFLNVPFAKYRVNPCNSKFADSFKYFWIWLSFFKYSTMARKTKICPRRNHQTSHSTKVKRNFPLRVPTKKLSQHSKETNLHSNTTNFNRTTCSDCIYYRNFIIFYYQQISCNRIILHCSSSSFSNFLQHPQLISMISKPA